MEAIKVLLTVLPFKMQVEFALYCALDVKVQLNKDDTTSLKALDLTARWLKDNTKVSGKELQDAAYAANAAAYAANAANAAYAAAYAAANAAYAAAYAAANAANAAANAAAYAAANAAQTKKLNQYEAHLKEMIKKLSDLEKAVYNLTNYPGG